MNSTSATAVIHGVLWALVLVWQAGVTVATGTLIVLAALLVVVRIRYDDEISTWWDRVEARIRRSSDRPSRGPTRLGVRQSPLVRSIGRIAAVAAVFAAGLTAGQLLEDDSSPSAAAITPITATETQDVDLTFGVANVTAGDEDYSDSVSARVDEVVKVQLTYSNRAEVDRGVSVGFRLSEPEDRQQFVTVDVDVDGTRAELSLPVQLSLDRSGLQIINGSIVWRHLSQTTGEAVEEVLPHATGGLIELERVAPGSVGSVTALARLQARVMTINLTASSSEHPDPAPYINAAPGGEVSLEATIGNAGNVPLRDVLARTHLAPGMLYMPGSTEVIRNEATTRVGDDIVNPIDPTAIGNTPRVGLRLGEIAVGQKVRIRWRVRLPDDAEGHTYCAVATAVAVGINEFYNTVAIGVQNVPSSCRGN